MDNIIPHNSANSDAHDKENKWRNMGFFSDGAGFVFVQKKTEKIIAALYLVSDLFKDEEPLKWELREKGICLLSACFSLNTSDPVDKSSAAQTIFETSLETIAHLRVASLSGLISKMNHEILEAELEYVIDTLHACIAEEKRQSGYVLSQAFFDVDQSNLIHGSLTTSSGAQDKKIVRDAARFDALNSHKRQNGIQPSRPPGQHPAQGQNRLGQSIQQPVTAINQQTQNAASKTMTPSGVTLGPVEVKRQNRRQTILDLFKDQASLTIKDCAAVIKDCSEKTIQRELLELVDLGILKKEGERRWSRYSLSS